MEDDDTPTALACDFKDCDYRCSDAGDLKTHKLTHTKPFACEECDYRCPRASWLERHMLTHSGEKPFACDVKDCNFSFSQAGSLKTHMLTHTGEKPFACDVKDCKYSCSLAGNLKTHMLTHSGDKPFACDVKDCNFSFSQAGSLKTHMLTHTGEKPFACDVKDCKFSCSLACNLERHMLTHTGEKHFACDVKDCNYSCSLAQNLKTHMLTHSGIKPFVCGAKDCKYSCTTAQHLKTHMLTHTGEKPFACDFEGCDYCCLTNGNLKTHKGVWHVRCQSEACAFYDQADRRPGTYLVDSKRYCYYCVLCLFPNMVKRKVRKEHFILAEIQRRVPELEKGAYHWKWDCPVEGGCSVLPPDMIFMFKDFYIQIEVDEEGHAHKSCVDEDKRLEIIAADAKKPGLVLRINPDSEPPAFKRFKLENGEAAWTATPAFKTMMDTVGGFLRKTLKRDSKSFKGLERCMIWTSSSEVATGSNSGWRADEPLTSV